MQLSQHFFVTTTMGASISKKEQTDCNHEKQNLDDMLSKSTDYTEDSTLPPSPASAGNVSYPYKEIKRGSISSPDVTQSASTAARTTHQESRQMHYWDGPILHRRDSDPGTPRHKTPTIPVKRASKPLHGLGESAASPPDAETDQYLQRLYDSRTWEMYRRITEARKNSNFSYTHTSSDAKHHEATSEWENLSHDHFDQGPSGHEMIFLFEFE